MEYHAAEAATCTAVGNVEYWFCADCGKYFSDGDGNDRLTSVTINKLGHDTVTHAEKEATCTEKGWKEYETCTR